MATTTKYDARKALTDYYLYVPLGAAQLAVQKAKELSSFVAGMAQSRRQDVMTAYRDLAGRGERLATSVRRSVYTRRAVEQTQTARRQVKGAATSVRRAASTTARATSNAARKVG